MSVESFGHDSWRAFDRPQAGDHRRRRAVEHLPESREVLIGFGEFAARPLDRGFELAHRLFQQPLLSQYHSQIVVAGGNAVSRLLDGSAVMLERLAVVSRALRF